MANISKEKRRNSEKRKEKSRDAARCRRSKETEIFCQLSQHLPLSVGSGSQLDKASIMRLAISFLKLKSIMKERSCEKEKEDDSMEKKVNQFYTKSLDGFILIVSKDGEIIFLSEQVVKVLGIQQIELIGHSIFDFSHPCDHDEIKDVLSLRGHNTKLIPLRCSFSIRMKCTLTNKGRNINLKSASYKVIQCTGVLVVPEIFKQNKSSQKEKAESNKIYSYLLAIGEPIPHPANIEVPLDSKTFLSKHSMDMKFIYCDERIKDLLGYNHEELIGQSLYIYHHALDCETVEKCYKDLFAKGQAMTNQYRFLAKNGGHVCVITQATILYHKPQCIVCVHYVLSSVESKESVLSEVQQISPTFQYSTDKIFAPKTKDMEQEYFVPPELKPSDSESDEPDLTHLAPTAGGVCVPLSFPVFSTDTLNTPKLDTFEPFSIRDQQLLKSEIPFSSFKEEPVEKKMPLCCELQQSLYMGSPCSSGGTSTPHLTSPPDYSHVNSPVDSDLNDKFSAMETNQQPPAAATTDLQEIESLNKMVSIEPWKTKGVDEKDISLDMKAPYIPMNTEDDLSLMPPTNESLLNLQADINPGLYGRTESVFGPKVMVDEDTAHKQSHSNIRSLVGASNAALMLQIPPSTKILQVKRPLNMNTLEKGPPLKMCKMDSGQANAGVKESPGKDSVLLNLLLTGEDRNHGYSVKNALAKRLPVSEGNEESECSSKIQNHRNSLLPRITQQDCEVNAPTLGLLQGEELLRALEVDVPTTVPFMFNVC